MDHDKCFYKDGSFLPWYNYPIIDFFGELDLSKITVFEYGCGYSTLFYAQRARFVYSVETRLAWLDKISNLAKLNNLTNIKITLYNRSIDVEFANYINHQDMLFDLIVCDSFDRIKCVDISLTKTTQNGLILLDNSDREQYRTIFEKMGRVGWKFITFSGLGPSRSEPSSSTLFYRQNNLFGLD